MFLEPLVKGVCACIAIGSGLGLLAGNAKASEVLRVTVGKPTLLSTITYQNTASLAMSRTGVIAAFYPKPDTGPRFYRTSPDGGKTWGPELASPPMLAGGAASVGLRDGGVLKALCQQDTPRGEGEWIASAMQADYSDGWFNRHSIFAWFSDDFTTYKTAPVKVYMPDAPTSKEPFAEWYYPVFDKGKILQLANGDLLAPMYGIFKGDTSSRVIVCSSSDRGHTWRFYATVAYEPVDPNTDLPGMYAGPCEPSIALMKNGQIICVMRTQYAHYANEYRPMAVCWSDDMGKTWTRPQLTNPHLMNIWPTVVALDNGVVACEYGRPGFHVAFSLDYGHTWQDRVSFCDLHEPYVTGMFDMIAIGPDKLAVIGNDAQGTKVWTITVERVKPRTSTTSITGRVIDEEGRPIVGARVELGGNRYAADSWVEVEQLDVWKQAPVLAAPPALGYQSIDSGKSWPVVVTDESGRYRFRGVKLAEYVLTVEADGFAPQWRHINVSLDRKQRHQEFRLKPGKSVRGRVVDSDGKPVGGACVVLGKTHIHADPCGWFSWAIEGSVPTEVFAKVYKRYDSRWKTFEGKLAPSEIEARPIVLESAR